MKKLKKCAMFTDIHWGRKNNSEQHNTDCLNYIKWFCEQVKNDSEIDHVIFLGDWFETRASVNGLTLKYSYDGAKLLSELNIPIYMIVGNHDLYYRHKRDVYTTYSFSSLQNFTFISEKPQYFEELGESGSIISPFLFEEEYPSLLEYSHVPVWFGHFEFKGFVLTGEHYKKEHGPDPQDFKNPKRIFSGHFHKRQDARNIYYIGNAFPADFSDANDSNRGMAIYEYKSDTLTYENWDECPMYVSCLLSELMDSKVKLYEEARVNCTVDIQIDYNESIELKTLFTNKYNLREFNLIEKINLKEVINEDDVDDSITMTTTEMVLASLDSIDEVSIDNEKLKNIYEGIK